MNIATLKGLLAGLPEDIEIRLQVEDENAHDIGGVTVCKGGDYLPADDEIGDDPVAFLVTNW